MKLDIPEKSKCFFSFVQHVGFSLLMRSRVCVMDVGDRVLVLHPRLLFYLPLRLGGPCCGFTL